MPQSPARTSVLPRRETTMSRGVRAVPALALFALACLCGLGSALAEERVLRVSAGFGHTAAVTAAGGLWTFGYGGARQLLASG